MYDKSCNLFLIIQYWDGITIIYDAWGKVLSVRDGDGNAITGINNIANRNPLRYRGYIYDDDTDLYYCQSRYYDPQIRRFINADGLVSTGSGFKGFNMFTYCGNNPVMYSDPSGESLIAALIGTIAAIGAMLSSCTPKPKKSKPKHVYSEPYESADEAAKAFSEEVYSSSAYIRHEYGTEIYSRTVNNRTTYNYNTPRAGDPHSVYVGNSTPEGTELVAYAHTHPNSNSFSKEDKDVAKFLRVDSYVIGPNLELQRYNVSSGTTTNLGVICPNVLTDEERTDLVNEFKISWDMHIARGCEFDCKSMIWPTP